MGIGPTPAAVNSGKAYNRATDPSMPITPYAEMIGDCAGSRGLDDPTIKSHPRPIRAPAAVRIERLGGFSEKDGRITGNHMEA